MAYRGYGSWDGTVYGTDVYMLGKVIKNLVEKHGVEILESAFIDIPNIAKEEKIASKEEQYVMIVKDIFGKTSKEADYISKFYGLRLENVPDKIDKYSSRYWFNDKGKYHRNNGPAFITYGYTNYWYRNGKLHRKDGPAIENADGDKEWYSKGCLHRTDGPAIELHDGTKKWCINGQIHREDGPAIENADGSKEWYINGQRHRENGPAIEFLNGHKEWWINGKRHREDGPAIEYVNGHQEWYVDGKLVKR